MPQSPPDRSYAASREQAMADFRARWVGKGVADVPSVAFNSRPDLGSPSHSSLLSTWSVALDQCNNKGTLHEGNAATTKLKESSP